MKIRKKLESEKWTFVSYGVCSQKIKNICVYWNRYDDVYSLNYSSKRFSKEKVIKKLKKMIKKKKKT